MSLFTSDPAVNADIATELTSCGCCARCTMRYLGLKDMHLYRGDLKEMDSMVAQYKNAKPSLETGSDVKQCDVASEVDNGSSNITNCVSNITPDINTDSKMDITDSHTNNGKTDISAETNSTDCKTDVTTDCDINSTSGKPDITDPLINDDKIGITADANSAGDKTDTITASDNACMDTQQGTNVKEVSSEPVDNASRGNIDTGNKSDDTCIVCLGILQNFAEDEFLKKVQKNAADEGFQYTIYMCSLMTPVCIILREHAIMLHLKEKFGSVYGNKTHADVAPVKDVWKWRCGPLLCDILAAPFDVKSPFDITLTFLYQNSNKECSFLLDTPDNDTFRKRKQDRRYNRRKPHFAVYNRANVTKAIKDMTEEEFKRSYQCPPLPTKFETKCDIKCQNDNVFLGGRYNKYSRILSQSPWIIEGVRKSESSVEELICTEINNNFKPDSSKFSASGREDVDVLMLGNGRPFVVELMNPRKREFTQSEINVMQTNLNSSTTDIKCSNLQIVSKDDTNILKEGEIDKVKKYRALCWCKEPVSDDQLKQLADHTELTILQKTPIRVLHRRPLATRDRIVHDIRVEREDKHHFRVDMSTQAGTYIKEFVHGDFGRTKPNFTSLLGQDCDILELDVTAVELDWPKQIDSG